MPDSLDLTQELLNSLGPVESDLGLFTSALSTVTSSLASVGSLIQEQLAPVIQTATTSISQFFGRVTSNANPADLTRESFAPQPSQAATHPEGIGTPSAPALPTVGFPPIALPSPQRTEGSPTRVQGPVEVKDLRENFRDALQPLLDAQRQVSERLATAQTPATALPILNPPGNVNAAPAPGSAPATGPSQQGAGGEEATGILGLLGESVGTLTLAIGAAVGAIGEVVSASRGFVSALSPSSILVLDQALRDLHATIGVALLPVIEETTAVFRTVASILLPLMEQLNPVVKSVSDVIGNVLEVAVEALASVFQAILPIIETLTPALDAIVGNVRLAASVFEAVLIPPLQLLADALRALQPIIDLSVVAFTGFADQIRAVVIVFQAFASTVAKAIGSLFPILNLSGITSNLKDAMGKLANWTVLAAAGLAQLVGATGFISELIKSIEGPKRKSAGGLGAATNASVKSFQDIARDLAVAAAVATAGGEKPATQEDILKESLGTLKALESGQIDLKETIKTAIQEAVKSTIEEVERIARERLSTATNSIPGSSIVRGALGGLGLGGR